MTRGSTVFRSYQKKQAYRRHQVGHMDVVYLPKIGLEYDLYVVVVMIRILLQLKTLIHSFFNSFIYSFVHSFLQSQVHPGQGCGGSQDHYHELGIHSEDNTSPSHTHSQALSHIGAI